MRKKPDSTTGLGKFEPQLQSCLHKSCPLKKGPMGASKKAMDLIKSKHRCKLVKKLFDDKKQSHNDSNNASIEDNFSPSIGSFGLEPISRNEMPQPHQLSKILHLSECDFSVMLNIPHESNTQQEGNPDEGDKTGNDEVNGAGKPQPAKESKNGNDVNVMLNIPHESNAQKESNADKGDETGNDEVNGAGKPQPPEESKNRNDANVKPNIPHESNAQKESNADKGDQPQHDSNVLDLSSVLPEKGEYTVMIAGKPMRVTVADKPMEDQPKPKPKIFVSDTESEKEIVSTEGKQVISEI